MKILILFFISTSIFAKYECEDIYKAIKETKKRIDSKAETTNDSHWKMVKIPMDLHHNQLNSVLANIKEAGQKIGFCSVELKSPAKKIYYFTVRQSYSKNYTKKERDAFYNERFDKEGPVSFNSDVVIQGSLYEMSSDSVSADITNISSSNRHIFEK